MCDNYYCEFTKICVHASKLVPTYHKLYKLYLYYTGLADKHLKNRIKYKAITCHSL